MLWGVGVGVGVRRPDGMRVAVPGAVWVLLGAGRRLHGGLALILVWKPTGGGRRQFGHRRRQAIWVDLWARDVDQPKSCKPAACAAKPHTHIQRRSAEPPAQS